MRPILTTVVAAVCLVFFAFGCAKEPPTVKVLRGESESWKAEVRFVDYGDNVTAFVTLNPRRGTPEGPLSATMVMEKVSGSVTLDVDNTKLDPPLRFQRRLELSPKDVQGITGTIDVTWSSKTKRETVSLQ
ncbi:MAG: hypothetical protein ACOYU7_09580 [Bacillota bacterium]